ncbi:MAG: hypothetical protein WD076_08250, partial [Parvularculaceae bacterium]
MSIDRDTISGGNDNRDGFEPARTAILGAALERAPFEGWTRVMMAAAAKSAGVDRSTGTAAFPRGVADLLTYWSESIDAEM